MQIIYHHPSLGKYSDIHITQLGQCMIIIALQWHSSKT